MPYPALSIAILLTAFAPALAQTAAPTTAPLLEQLSTQTQALYQSVRPGMVRVELPPPKWLSQLIESENPAAKWNGRLDEQMQAQLRALQESAAAGHPPTVQAYIATTQPITAPTTEPTPIDTQAPGQPALLGNRVVGITLDNAGHVLIPLFIEKEAVDGRTISAVGADDKITTAHFVGSDRQTNLTILQLDKPAGTPVKLNGTRPADGSLVMLLSPNGDGGRLSVWTGGQQDRGMVIAANGDIAGFVRFGQFLCGDAIRPLAQQIIQYGKVRRATLGVLVSQAQAPDGRHAIHVEKVMENSPAAAAGLQDGDFVLSLAGAAVVDLPSFAAVIAERDGPTELQILRDGKAVTITADLHPR